MDTNAWFHDKVQSVLERSSTTSSGQFHRRKIPIAVVESAVVGDAALRRRPRPVPGYRAEIRDREKIIPHHQGVSSSAGGRGAYQARGIK